MPVYLVRQKGTKDKREKVDMTDHDMFISVDLSQLGLDALSNQFVFEQNPKDLHTGIADAVRHDLAALPHASNNCAPAYVHGHLTVLQESLVIN